MKTYCSKPHPDIKALNKSDPPPKGCRHPAYEVTGSNGKFSLAYLHNGAWNMPVRSFGSKESALQFLLDILYYGEE